MKLYQFKYDAPALAYLTVLVKEDLKRCSSCSVSDVFACKCNFKCNFLVRKRALQMLQNYKLIVID